MMQFNGHLCWKQYMHKKPEPSFNVSWHFATGFCANFSVYRGRDYDQDAYFDLGYNQYSKNKDLEKASTQEQSTISLM